MFCIFLSFVVGQSSLFPMEDGFLDDGRGDQTLHSGLGSPHCFSHQNGERVERYSRKVFVGGLPPDIDEGIPGYLYSQELPTIIKCQYNSNTCVSCGLENKYLKI